MKTQRAQHEQLQEQLASQRTQLQARISAMFSMYSDVHARMHTRTHARTHALVWVWYSAAVGGSGDRFSVVHVTCCTLRVGLLNALYSACCMLHASSCRSHGAYWMVHAAYYYMWCALRWLTACCCMQHLAPRVLNCACYGLQLPVEVQEVEARAHQVAAQIVLFETYPY